MMGNKTLAVVISLFIVCLLGVFVVWKSLGTSRGGSSQEKIVQTDGLTTVKLSVERNGIYSPQSIKVKTGTKIRIEGDPKTLSGTMDTIIVDGYELNKKIVAGDNVLEFVASNPGEFKIHCAYGMGNGVLIVE